VGVTGRNNIPNFVHDIDEFHMDCDRGRDTGIVVVGCRDCRDIDRVQEYCEGGCRDLE
jgi:hypothetical protein